MIKQKRDFFSGCVLILVSSYILFGQNIAVGRTLGKMPKLANAVLYVRLLGGILGFLSILLVIRALTSDKTQDARNIPKEVVLTSIALILYALVLDLLGFFLSSVVLISFLTFIYRIKEKHLSKNDKPSMLKAAGISIIYSLICVALLQYVFTSLLGARLP